MSNSYLLSICIPTANRKLELGKQLTGIILQSNRLKDNSLLQVVIGDNTDHEEQLINLESFSELNIKYIKNESNLGYAKNINSVIKNADGKFCWLLSDDDYLFETAISTVIDNLQNRDVNYATCECGGAYNGKLFSDKMYFRDIDQSFFEKGNDFLEKYWESVIFVSINIFNRDNVLRHMDEYGLSSDINEVFQNSLIGVTFISRFGKVLVISDPLLNDNYGNKVYLPQNINDAAVDKYYKLLKQFMMFNIPKKVIDDMSNNLFSSVFRQGLLSVVYSIEYQSVDNYRKTYKKLYRDARIAKKVRFISFIVYLLLIFDKRVSRVAVKFILLFKGNFTYSKTKKELDTLIAQCQTKIHSTY